MHRLDAEAPAIFPPPPLPRETSELGFGGGCGAVRLQSPAPMEASAAQTGKGSRIHRRVASGCFWNGTSLGMGRTQKGTPGMVPRDGGRGRKNT